MRDVAPHPLGLLRRKGVAYSLHILGLAGRAGAAQDVEPVRSSETIYWNCCRAGERVRRTFPTFLRAAMPSDATRITCPCNRTCYDTGSN